MIGLAASLIFDLAISGAISIALEIVVGLSR